MTTVLGQQNRAAGIYRSSPIASDTLPQGQIVRATGIMSAASRQNSALTVTMGVEANDTPNAGANDPGWYVHSSSTWHGGAQTRDGTFPPPTGESPTSGLPPTVRGYMELAQTTNIGIDVSVL